MMALPLPEAGLLQLKSLSSDDVPLARSMSLPPFICKH
jgi:hypothetical protein